MAKVIAAVVTDFGLGKLMVFYLVNKLLTFCGKREFVTVLKLPASGSRPDLV